MRHFFFKYGFALKRCIDDCKSSFVLGLLSFLVLLTSNGFGGTDGSAIDWDEAASFWSVQPPISEHRPSVGHKDWPKQRLDFFILSALESINLIPAPPASKAVLLRRLYYDLTGLPPSYEQVVNFVNDSAPDAYQQRVDRLLETPRFGERMASMWLNLARYAEDQAHQVGTDTKQFYPNAYRYRRWVIDAFNRDLGYADFIKLQLAGDLFEGTKHEDLVATGFIGLGSKYYNRGRLDVKAEEWADQVDTVMRTFQGLTVSCARCHDHKFDPITMRDYYGLAGVFASTELVNVAYDKPSDQVSEEDLKAHRFTAHLVKDKKGEDVSIFERGNVDQPGEKVPRGFLQWLSSNQPVSFQTKESGRRELAERISSKDNPLTARVYVNRLWSLFFGRGIVSSLSNFGALGDQPTHPKLLDDLATRFTKHGGLTKPLIREMVLSSTYRQSSAANMRSNQQDPDNQWFSRMSRRRLSVEMWRDSLLAVSGNLHLKGGSSLELDDPVNVRRTVYARVSRLKLNDLLIQMDYPDANVHAAKRSVTTTPLQKLFAMNSPFMHRQADSLVARLDFKMDLNDCINQMYRNILSRQPDSTEHNLAKAFLIKPNQEEPSSERWVLLAQALMISNEMLYID
ncbi:MAG: DUF1553 domain-containing protein [Verrucomicrobia bacterium]|nr:DUF1553 domain-containing protein [Verrucomicrobiota bacterium]